MPFGPKSCFEMFVVFDLVVFPNSNLGESQILVWENSKVRFENLGLPFFLSALC